MKAREYRQNYQEIRNKYIGLLLADTHRFDWNENEQELIEKGISLVFSAYLKTDVNVSYEDIVMALDNMLEGDLDIKTVLNFEDHFDILVEKANEIASLRY
jgi:hypothetical protein